MKIIGLLCFYDESPNWLAATVTSLARVVDHMVAVDGAYFLFPGGRERPRSGLESHEAIHAAAYSAGIGATVHAPADVFYGNEVEKRSLMFRLAEPLVEPGRDWYLIVDADEIVTHVGAGLRARLEQTRLDVAAYQLWWRNDLHATQQLDEASRRFHMPNAGATAVRGLMRALPGLRCAGAHYVYVADRAGRTIYLWGNPSVHDLEPELDLTDELKLEHRHAYRALERQKRAAGYYERRDQAGAETLTDLYMEGLDGEPVLVQRAGSA